MRAHTTAHFGTHTRAQTNAFWRVQTPGEIVGQTGVMGGRPVLQTNTTSEKDLLAAVEILFRVLFTVSH